VRYRGPKAKVMRRFGLALAASPKYQRILELDRDQLTGRLVRAPERDEIPVPIDDRLIVEFYSR